MLSPMSEGWCMRQREEAARTGHERDQLMLVEAWKVAPGRTRTPEEIAKLAEETWGKPVDTRLDRS